LRPRNAKLCGQPGFCLATLICFTTRTPVRSNGFLALRHPPNRAGIHENGFAIGAKTSDTPLNTVGVTISLSRVLKPSRNRYPFLSLARRMLPRNYGTTCRQICRLLPAICTPPCSYHVPHIRVGIAPKSLAQFGRCPVTPLPLFWRQVLTERSPIGYPLPNGLEGTSARLLCREGGDGVLGLRSAFSRHAL
jgi:hypothetical protein